MTGCIQGALSLTAPGKRYYEIPERIGLPEDLEVIGPNTFDAAQLSFLPDLSGMIEE